MKRYGRNEMTKYERKITKIRKYESKAIQDNIVVVTRQ